MEDVISHNKCICRTEEGKVLEELCQSMLETVIPRGESAHVMIVKGTHLGKVRTPSLIGTRLVGPYYISLLSLNSEKTEGC